MTQGGKRLLVVIQSAYIGGAELCIYESIKALHAEGWVIDAVFPREGMLQEKLAPYTRSQFVVFYEWWADHYQHTPLRKVKWLYHAWKSARAIAAIIRKQGYDRVLTNTMTLAVGGWAAAMAGVPHYWYIHEFGPEDHRLYYQFGEARSVNWMVARSRAIIVNSEVVARKYRPYAPQKTYVLNYGMETPAFTYQSNDYDGGTLQLVMVGRVYVGKNQEDAVRSVAELKSMGITAHLTIVGGQHEEYKAQLEVLSRELGVFDQITWVPFTTNPMHYYQRAHVAVVCSRSEAFGRVSIEAMKGGKPVVASATGANPDLIQEGKTGYLYPIDQPREMAERLARFVRNPELLDQMGRQAFEWAWANFSMEKHGRELAELLQK